VTPWYYLRKAASGWPRDTTIQEVITGWGEPIRFGVKGASEYVPTWQRGQEQPQPNDFSRYATEGYSNSVIFPIISLRAQSFAGLSVMLQRDDELSDDNAVIELLRNPSSAMDGFEFNELLCTHLDLHGNAYIEKDRKPTPDFPERRSWPIKQLGLIRPDYVEIVPGLTRHDDMFVVKVNGQEIKRLQRKDVIHVKVPNPGNDFYGLSPLAVLARTADLDTYMTDFDISFFRNAGVPMGLLKTKTRHSPDETRQIKRSFRNTFNGVKRWFEVLILNSDEAEYQPLGSKPDEMEMTDTRAHVESRACAVYGVPPIIVGFLVGLENSPWSNYENAHFAFWSETMIPLAGRISGALTRELLPEFRTTRDRGAILVYDTSKVKALQEDNTARLEAVGKLIATGGFTINQALQLHGLPEVDNGEFYVRSLTQVIDTTEPMASPQRIGTVTDLPARAVPTERQAEALGEPMMEAGYRLTARKDSTEDILDRVRRSREPLVTRAQADIERFLSGQAERVLARMPKDGEIPPDEDAQLENVLRPHFSAGAQNGWSLASDLMGLPADFDPADPRVITLLNSAGENVRGINDVTRSALRDILAQSRSEGWSISMTRDAIRNMGEFSASRAETIARTELARADNLGAVSRYSASGLVDEVTVIDGPECGWTSHDDPDTAHGSTRTLADAQAYPYAHPRCVRSVAPIIRGGNQ
jgi:HK97 family phage portal protein